MSSKKKKKKTGPGIGEFRKSARTGFLDENAWEEASSGAQVRFTEEFDKVMDEESTWLTPKEALTLTQASESTGKPRLAAIHKMILGQKYKTVSDAVKKAKLGGGMRGVIETYNPTKQCEAALSQFAEEEVVGQPE